MIRLKIFSGIGSNKELQFLPLLLAVIWIFFFLFSLDGSFDKICTFFFKVATCYYYMLISSQQLSWRFLIYLDLAEDCSIFFLWMFCRYMVIFFLLMSALRFGLPGKT